MSRDKRIRLHPYQQRLVILALLRLAREDPSTAWDCWLVARSLAVDTRGKRPRWQGKRETEEMLQDMEAWGKAVTEDEGRRPQST